MLHLGLRGILTFEAVIKMHVARSLASVRVLRLVEVLFQNFECVPTSLGGAASKEASIFVDQLIWH